MKWQTMNELGELDGYVRGVPPQHGIVDGIAIDKEVAEQDPCQECGGAMEYVPMIATSSYRAFSRCKECGETEEF